MSPYPRPPGIFSGVVLDVKYGSFQFCIADEPVYGLPTGPGRVCATAKLWDRLRLRSCPYERPLDREGGTYRSSYVSENPSDSSSSNVEGNTRSRMAEENWPCCGLEEKDELRMGTGWPRVGLNMREAVQGLPLPPRLDGMKCWEDGEERKAWSDERGGWLAARSRSDAVPPPPLPLPFSVPPGLVWNLLFRPSSSRSTDECGWLMEVLWAMAMGDGPSVRMG